MTETTECQACTAPARAGYLCPRCTAELRDMLRSFTRGPYITAVAGKTKSGGGWMIERRTPGLLEHLAEAAIGQVRLQDGGRRTRRNVLVEYTDPKTATDGLGGTEGQRRLEEDAEHGRLAESSVLRQGGVNPKASRLLTETNDVLHLYMKAFHPVTPKQFAAIPSRSVPGSIDMADWLSRQMAAITLSEHAGAFYAAIDHLTRRIEKVIDRPEPPRTCGPCPTIVGVQRQECATALEAQPGEHQVTCPSCDQTYNVEDLITRTFNALHYKTFTIRELVDTVLPRLQEPVPQKTLERWVRNGWVPIAGYDANEHQMLRLSDVRRVRGERPRHAKRAG